MVDHWLLIFVMIVVWSVEIPWSKRSHMALIFNDTEQMSLILSSNTTKRSHINFTLPKITRNHSDHPQCSCYACCPINKSSPCDFPRGYSPLSMSSMLSRALQALRGQIRLQETEPCQSGAMPKMTVRRVLIVMTPGLLATTIGIMTAQTFPGSTMPYGSTTEPKTQHS